jgi:hypothetical protein
VINIQTREITDNLASLVKQIDAMVDNAADRSNDTKHAFVVLITDDPDAAEAKLQKLAEDKQIKNIPLTVFDGIAGPSDYKIAEKAEVTVMMWVDQEVKVNRAFGADELDATAVEQVVADAKKHLE